MKIHSIYVPNKNNLLQLLVKDLAWFCEFCLDSHWTYNSKMFNGQGCQSNFSLMILNVQKKKRFKCGIEINNLDYTKGSYIHYVMISLTFLLLLIHSCSFSQFVVIFHVGNNFGYCSRDWG